MVVTNLSDGEWGCDHGQATTTAKVVTMVMATTMASVTAVVQPQHTTAITTSCDDAQDDWRVETEN